MDVYKEYFRKKVVGTNIIAIANKLEIKCVFSINIMIVVRQADMFLLSLELTEGVCIHTHTYTNCRCWPLFRGVGN